MFAPKLLINRFAGLYTYPCTKLTFFLPYNCLPSIRKLSARKTPGISYGVKSLKASRNLQKMSSKLQTRKKPFVPRNFATKYTTAPANSKVCSTFQKRPCKGEAQVITPMLGLKEFFSHPLTWDRNNGYMNILLGLAIFGYCFCTTCSGDRTTSGSSHEGKK